MSTQWSLGIRAELATITSVVANRILTTGGGADKNLDWLSSDPQAPAVLDGTAQAE